MHKLHSLHLLALFAVLMLAWHINMLSLGDDTYTGLMLAWWIAGSVHIYYLRKNGELAYENCH